MNVTNARKLLKQHQMTIRRITNILAAAPASAEFVYDTLHKQGGRDSKGVIAQYIRALVVLGKVVETRRGIFTTDFSLKDTQEVPNKPVSAKIKDLWPTPAAPKTPRFQGSQIASAIQPTETKREKPEMDITKLTPEQLSTIASQLQQLADERSRELNPELLQQLLVVVESVVSASDLLLESIEKMRGLANQIREVHGGPVKE